MQSRDHRGEDQVEILERFPPKLQRAVSKNPKVGNVIFSGFTHKAQREQPNKNSNVSMEDIANESSSLKLWSNIVESAQQFGLSDELASQLKASLLTPTLIVFAVFLGLAYVVYRRFGEEEVRRSNFRAQSLTMFRRILCPLLVKKPSVLV